MATCHNSRGRRRLRDPDRPESGSGPRRLRSSLHRPGLGLVALDPAGEGDLVITDVVMPDENAFDVLPRIKKLRPDLPIIVMSAQNTFMTAIKASERGAYEYLPKPFDLKELIAIVARALSRPKNVSVAGDDQQDDIPLVGRSPAMQEIYRALARLMQTDLTVMITGESGTGQGIGGARPP